MNPQNRANDRVCGKYACFTGVETGTEEPFFLTCVLSGKWHTARRQCQQLEESAI
jgi:hypothetical protein